MKNSINNTLFKCKLFIQFGYFDIAFQIIKQNNLFELLPLISNKSFHFNCINIIEESQKLLLKK